MWLEPWGFLLPASTRLYLQVSFLTVLDGSPVPDAVGHGNREGTHQRHPGYTKLCPELAGPSGMHGEVHFSESF